VRVPVQATTRRVTFGPFELDTATAELRRSGKPVKIAPQPARVLAMLVDRAGDIVTRAELKDAIWGGDTFVDFDQGLNFCIRQIRSVLGDDAAAPAYVETVPRRGYRFVAAVQPVPVDGPPAADGAQQAVPRRPPRTAAALLFALLVMVCAVVYLVVDRVDSQALPGRTMVAVLPFEDLSGEAAKAYFAAGITDELTSQLARVAPARLAVIGRHSAAAYDSARKPASAIGGELGVQHLVTGAVRRSGSRIRISAQLIRTSDDSQVWADIFEADLSDILTVQRRIGEAIAGQVLARLSPAGAHLQRTTDPRVYDFYLRGRFHWNHREPLETERAIASFTEALRLDPTFAPAHAGLGDCYMVTTGFEAALAAADRAIALDDALAEAHVTRAHALMHQLRWDEADVAFRRAIALDPSNPAAHYFYGEYLVARGRRSEAVREGLQAVVVDPLNAITRHAAGTIAYHAGEYDAALPHLRRALELDPAHYWTSYRLGLVYERKGMLEEALAAFDRTADPLRGVFALARAGRATEARRIVADAFARPEVEHRAYHLASALTALGEHDQAVHWLSVALDRRVYDVVYLGVDPRFDDLRARADFRALMQRGGW
jgi:TolB-like protein/DNA-binding winged helix-turn-helix (wHTH) protein/Tfp pilus assembly protein PilF